MLIWEIYIINAIITTMIFVILSFKEERFEFGWFACSIQLWLVAIIFKLNGL